MRPYNALSTCVTLSTNIRLVLLRVLHDKSLFLVRRVITTLNIPPWCTHAHPFRTFRCADSYHWDTDTRGNTSRHCHPTSENKKHYTYIVLNILVRGNYLYPKGQKGNVYPGNVSTEIHTDVHLRVFVTDLVFR